jgi:hypothetical protein
VAKLKRLGKAKLKLSRQQVHNYLKESWAKSLLYKQGDRYFMKHAVTYDDWSIFSEYISRLQYFPNFRDLWQNREVSIKFSKEFCREYAASVFQSDWSTN